MVFLIKAEQEVHRQEVHRQEALDQKEEIYEKNWSLSSKKRLREPKKMYQLGEQKVTRCAMRAMAMDKLIILRVFFR